MHNRDDKHTKRPIFLNTGSTYYVIILSFYPSARWARRGIVVPFVRRRLRRRRRTHSFGYYTNMVQQIKFIIHTNIQPLPALFFTQGQGQGQKTC